MSEYRIFYYKDSTSGKKPVREFIFSLSPKVRSKIFKYIEELGRNDGYMVEPYSRHIVGDIRELRVDFGHSRHRIFYFTFVGKRIIILHGFLKKTAKTPEREIQRAIKYHHDVIINPHLYE